MDFQSTLLDKNKLGYHYQVHIKRLVHKDLDHMDLKVVDSRFGGFHYTLASIYMLGCGCGHRIQR